MLTNELLPGSRSAPDAAAIAVAGAIEHTPACLTRDTVAYMAEVAVRDLRNHGGEILNRVAAGEALTVTRDGEPIAELRPLPRRPLPSHVLLNRWRRLPLVDPAQLRTDIDNALDASL